MVPWLVDEKGCVGMNLMETLQKEIRRNTKLLEIYKSEPRTGFAAVMIAQDIRDAELAIANDHTVAMIRLLQELQENSE